MKWQELDQCKTADEIAKMLGKTGIKGIPGIISECALARAIGGLILISLEWDAACHDHQFFVGDHLLTAAEINFIRNFDREKYPDLIDVAAFLPIPDRK